MSFEPIPYEQFDPTKMKPGLFADVPMMMYRRTDPVSASDLKNLERSPAFARMKRRGSASTDAQDWGTAVHTAILEPHLLGDLYPLDPPVPADFTGKVWRATNRYKDLRDERLAQDGVDFLLTQDQSDDLVWIQQRVNQNDIGSNLHASTGFRELSGMVWDEKFEMWRKFRPDWWIPEAKMLVDIKKVESKGDGAGHNPGPFGRAIKAWGHHISAAFYVDSMALLGHEIEYYVYLVINGKAPFEVRSYELGEASLKQGRREYKALLHSWKECVETGSWPAGQHDMEEIELPHWALDDEDW